MEGEHLETPPIQQKAEDPTVVPKPPPVSAQGQQTHELSRARPLQPQGGAHLPALSHRNTLAG